MKEVKPAANDNEQNYREAAIAERICTKSTPDTRHPTSSPDNDKKILFWLLTRIENSKGNKEMVILASQLRQYLAFTESRENKEERK